MSAAADLARSFGLRFLDEDSRETLQMILMRLATGGQELVFATCAPCWRSRVELAIALMAAPTRIVRVIQPRDQGWAHFLAGTDPEGLAPLWVVRGCTADMLERSAHAMNLARDTMMQPGRRVWVWLLPTEAAIFLRQIPDLWRYRTAAPVLRVPSPRQLRLPTPLPKLIAPRGGETGRSPSAAR